MIEYPKADFEKQQGLVWYCEDVEYIPGIINTLEIITNKTSRSFRPCDIITLKILPQILPPHLTLITAHPQQPPQPPPC